MQEHLYNPAQHPYTVYDKGNYPRNKALDKGNSYGCLSSAHLPFHGRHQAATQGVYSNVNTRNTIAVNGVNNTERADISPPSKTVSVETTLSFAVKPVINAVEIRQSPKPSGTNNGAKSPPSFASRLASGVAATIQPDIKGL